MPRRAKQKDPLAEKIERLQGPISAKTKVDRVDDEVEPYIEAFLKGLPEAVKLEKFNLSTPEEARKALLVIDETLQRLNQQIANARALQQLVLSNKSE